MRKRLIMAAALAAISVSTVGCAGSDIPSTPQAKVETLDVTWSLTKAATVAYIATCRLKPDAAICSVAVVDQASKALEVAEVGVAEARRSILAAGGDQSKLSKAVAYGLSAIALFQQAMLTYGVSSG